LLSQSKSGDDIVFIDNIDINTLKLYKKNIDKSSIIITYLVIRPLIDVLGLIITPLSMMVPGSKHVCSPT